MCKTVFAFGSRRLRSPAVYVATAAGAFVWDHFLFEQIWSSLGFAAVSVGLRWASVFYSRLFLTCSEDQLWLLLLLAGSEVAKHLLLLLQVSFDVVSFFIYVLTIILLDAVWKMIISRTKALRGVGSAKVISKSWCSRSMNGAPPYFAISSSSHLSCFSLRAFLFSGSVSKHTPRYHWPRCLFLSLLLWQEIGLHPTHRAYINVFSPIIQIRGLVLGSFLATFQCCSQIVKWVDIGSLVGQAVPSAWPHLRNFLVVTLEVFDRLIEFGRWFVFHELSFTSCVRAWQRGSWWPWTCELRRRWLCSLPI